MDKIPETIFKMRVRKHQDCSITIPRRNRKAEEYLDARFQRQRGELKWYPITVEGKDVSDHENQYEGTDGYVVGKGPSLDHLRASDFPDADSPIIAINEAIHVVEALDLPNDVYGMQQDAMLGQTCLPKKAPLMLPQTIQYFYPDLQNKYIYRLDQFSVGLQALSAQVSLGILKLWGCRHIKLVSFDACVDRSLSYAKVIGHPPVDDPSRFLVHCNRIANTAHSLGVVTDHVTPEARPEASSYTPESTSDNQPEHHEPPSYPPSESRQDSSDSPSETEQDDNEQLPDHSGSEQQS